MSQTEFKKIKPVGVVTGFHAAARALQQLQLLNWLPIKGKSENGGEFSLLPDKLKRGWSELSDPLLGLVWAVRKCVVVVRTAIEKVVVGTFSMPRPKTYLNAMKFIANQMDQAIANPACDWTADFLNRVFTGFTGTNTNNL